MSAPCLTHASPALKSFEERLAVLEATPPGEGGPHTHPISEVTDLQAALDGKSNTHSHPYAATVHAHPISEVTGLQTALDGKQASGSYALSNHDHDQAYAAIDHTHASSGGPAVKSGLANVTAGGSSNVVFVSPFASVPQVVVTSQINNADTSCTYSVHSVTVNGFTIRGAGNPAGNVAWIATTAGNG